VNVHEQSQQYKTKEYVMNMSCVKKHNHDLSCALKENFDESENINSQILSMMYENIQCLNMVTKEKRKN